MNVGLGVRVGIACPPLLIGFAAVDSDCPFPVLEPGALAGLLTDVITSVTVVDLVPPTVVVVTVVNLICVVVELLPPPLPLLSLLLLLLPPLPPLFPSVPLSRFNICSRYEYLAVRLLVGPSMPTM